MNNFHLHGAYIKVWVKLNTTYLKAGFRSSTPVNARFATGEVLKAPLDVLDASLLSTSLLAATTVIPKITFIGTNTKSSVKTGGVHKKMFFIQSF